MGTSESMKKETKDRITYVKDFYRVKTYTKPEEMFVPQREREFSEPYMVAQSVVGGTWNDHNAPFMIQVAGCNMRCPYCFVPASLKANEGEYFSADEIVQMRDENEPEKRTIRISGGEPFLAPQFISSMGETLAERNNTFLWVDTNLIGNKYADVVSSLYYYLDKRFGVCACFKGFDEETYSISSGIDGSIEKQWKNAETIYNTMKDEQMMENPPFFFYVPEIRLIHDDNSPKRLKSIIGNFMDELNNRIHENAALRVTVLYLKEYDANRGWIETLKANDPSFVDVEKGTSRKIWNELLKERYPTEMIWLPQSQIVIS
jgi:pyruvate-formate lyase-activating enzyme